MTDALKVMYVDDEPDIRMIGEFSLEDEPDMTLLICDGGPAAIAEAAAFRPDVVLLDVMMPGMDGPSTLQHLRAMPELAGARFAFVTAKVQAQEVAHLRSLGAVAVIAKPFDPMSLAEQVRNLGKESHG